MAESTTGDSVDFFVDGKLVHIRRVNSGDAVSDNTLSTLLDSADYAVLGKWSEAGDESLARLVNSAGVFVHAAFLQEDDTEDIDDLRPLAIAVAIDKPSLAREMSILVVRQFVESRIPFEIARVLLAEAAEHGALTVTTTDSSQNSSMRKLAGKIGMSVRIEPHSDGRTIRYSIQTDPHPGIVKF